MRAAMRNWWVCGLWVVTVSLTNGCGSSGGNASAGSSSMSVEDFCQSVGQRYCAQDKPCCASANEPFNQAACELQFTSFCLSNATAVARGTATLQSEKLDECIRASQPYYDKCMVTNSDYQLLRAADVACTEYFKGTVPVGGACMVDGDCAPGPYGAGCSAGACYQPDSSGTYPEVGDPCDVSNSDCDQGLICSDTTSMCVVAPPAPLVSAAECAGTL